MNLQEYVSKVRDFVEQYNAQSFSQRGYLRLSYEQADDRFVLYPERGECIFWPEQIYHFAHENGLLMYFTVEPQGNTMKPVVTLFPASEMEV